MSMFYNFYELDDEVDNPASKTDDEISQFAGESLTDNLSKPWTQYCSEYELPQYPDLEENSIVNTVLAELEAAGIEDMAGLNLLDQLINLYPSGDFESMTVNPVAGAISKSEAATLLEFLEANMSADRSIHYNLLVEVVGEAVKRKKALIIIRN